MLRGFELSHGHRRRRDWRLIHALSRFIRRPRAAYRGNNMAGSMKEFGIGASVTLGRTISESDVYLFGGITGDLGRNHIDEEYARTQTHYGKRVVHGALLVGLASAASTLIGDRYDKGKWRGAS